jgi:hypothetical protein
MLAAGPELRITGAAAQTRMVSVVRIRLVSRKSVRPLACPILQLGVDGSIASVRDPAADPSPSAVDYSWAEALRKDEIESLARVKVVR